MIDPGQDPVWRSLLLYVAVGTAGLALQQSVLTPLLPWLSVQPLVALTVHAAFRRGPKEAAWIATFMGLIWDVTSSGIFGAGWFRLMAVLAAVMLLRRFVRDTVPFLLVAAALATVLERVLLTVEYSALADWNYPGLAVLRDIPLAAVLNTVLAAIFIVMFDRIFRTRMFRLVRTGIDVGGGYGGER